MAFFKKLRDRMFRSSDKISEGLEALVADTPADAPVEAPAEAAVTPAQDVRPEVRDAAAKPAMAHPAAADTEPAAKPSLLGRLLGRDETRRLVDDAMLESLEDLLIQADLGVDTALRVTANIAGAWRGRRVSTGELKGALAAEVARIMEPVARPLPLYPQKPQVVLVVGVNGSGKTTTIGKLASQFKAAGKSVVIAAGDTFRAAAVEQLQQWAQRAGCGFVRGNDNADPASVAYAGVEKAIADGADIVFIDTAGRLHTKENLMAELSKIRKVIAKLIPDAPHAVVQVLDATTGQNALAQVKAFREVAGVTGLIVTKLDGTAKAGIIIALAEQFKLPIHAIGVGEGAEDLQPFVAEDFARALVGI